MRMLLSTRSVFANDKFVKLMQDVITRQRNEIMLLIIYSLISKEKRIVSTYRQGMCVDDKMNSQDK